MDRSAAQEYTTESEVYAFAVIAWEMLTGDRPWRVDSKGRSYNDAAVVMAVISGERPKMPARLPLLSAGGQQAHSVLRRIVRESWAHEPHQRPAFAKVSMELRDELRRERERRSGLHELSRIRESEESGQEDLSADEASLGI